MMQSKIERYAFHLTFRYLHLVHTILFSASVLFSLLSVHILLSLPDEDKVWKTLVHFEILSSFVIYW